MSKLANILNGYKNLLIRDKTVEDLALQRLNICSSCPQAKPSLIVTLIKGSETEEAEGAICGSCGCPLMAKTRSVSDDCPLDKWPKNTKT